MPSGLEWLGRLSRWPRGRCCLLLVGLMLAVAVADYASGERYTVYVLYFPVVALSCWTLGLTAALVLSFFSSILWIVDDIFAPPEPIPYLAKYWQALTRFLVFALFAYMLSRLRTALYREYQLSHYDELTGLANRTSLFENGQRDVSRCRRTDRPLTAVFVDLDQFKQVNDRDGHAEGDRVLRAVADAIRESTRDTDLTARIGGDEFVIVSPEMSYDDAQRYTQRLQEHLRSAMQHGGWPVTFSIGAATFNEPPLRLDDIVKVADDLMYDVKRKQKDAVHHCLVERSAVDVSSSIVVGAA
ncbi:MAG TPA: GGDEF domain-containing protein [Pirellulales bacterium]